ncbi:L-histidine N(alpha)-methyltransferase [Myxosarcina sp. GI1(2024)]
MSAFQGKTGDRNSIENRLQIEYLLDTQVLERDDAEEVIQGLTKYPKTIPPRYFYDSRGSQLFEEICQQPEYYPTRTEARILEQFAEEIAQTTTVSELIELGSGSSTKTRLLLDAYSSLNSSLVYLPIDVSNSILKASAYSLLTDYPQLKISGKVATYQQALERLAISYSDRKIIVFLGSSIGNFSPQQCDRFIEQIKQTLNKSDYFLLGLDLQKSSTVLTAAYNDARGVTAAFNLNMLRHLNARFQGYFNLDLFKHQAIYNNVEKQMEMYLISQKAHAVNLKALDLKIEFARGEKILTEISRKFDLEQMSAYLTQKNLQIIKNYTDSQQWFGLILCQKTE